MNGIPSDSFGSTDGRLVEAFHAKSRHFIKSGATVLQPIIRCPARRAECLATRLAPVATTLSASSHIEAVTNDGSGVAFSRGRAMLVGTVETLHGWWTSQVQDPMPPIFSLKLYHAREFLPGYQHLMTEAPHCEPVSL